jgi:sulfopyruvate decarboxylase subunit beta
MNRLEAIRIIVGSLKGDELLVHANGAIGRESFFCRNRKENFYLLGAMGLASSVGLGLALARPERRVIILDGDGNLLMGLGNLALIGAARPENLVHLVLDNRVYGTTGNQPTLSASVPLSEVARASGYPQSACAGTPEELKELLREASGSSGPHFIQVRVSSEVVENCPRIPQTAREIRQRFMAAISAGGDSNGD